MATAEELLNASLTGEDRTLIISNDFRTITIPASVKCLGVENDDDVLELKFEMPRYLGDLDLSTFAIRVNYMNAQGEKDAYTVNNPIVDADYITFSWLVGPTATKYKGNTSFNVCLKILNSDGNVDKEFNTTIATLPVLQGLEADPAIVAAYSDIIEQWRQELFITGTSAAGATAGQVPTADGEGGWSWENQNGGGTDGKSAYAYAVEGGYTGTEDEFKVKMAAEIPEVDNTLTKSGQAADAAVVGNELSSLSEEIVKQDDRITELEVNGTGGSGLTTKQKSAILACFQNTAWAVDNGEDYYNALVTAFADSSDGDSGSSSDTATLTSIAAVYNGDDVPVGTDANDLDITVTAVYSDGTMKTVTGYTITGTVEEGENTFTVSYVGKTATITVTGYIRGILTDGTYTANNITVTVTNGKHVLIDCTALTSTINTSVNLSDIAANIFTSNDMTAINNHATFLTVASGVTETLSITNIVNNGMELYNISGNMRLANESTSGDLSVKPSNNWTATNTPTADTSYGCLFLYGSLVSGASLEFDVVYTQS